MLSRNYLILLCNNMNLNYFPLEYGKRKTCTASHEFFSHTVKIKCVRNTFQFSIFSQKLTNAIKNIVQVVKKIKSSNSILLP